MAVREPKEARACDRRWRAPHFIPNFPRPGDGNPEDPSREGCDASSLGTKLPRENRADRREPGPEARRAPRRRHRRRAARPARARAPRRLRQQGDRAAASAPRRRSRASPTCAGCRARPVPRSPARPRPTRASRRRCCGSRTAPRPPAATRSPTCPLRSHVSAPGWCACSPSRRRPCGSWRPRTTASSPCDARSTATRSGSASSRRARTPEHLRGDGPGGRARAQRRPRGALALRQGGAPPDGELATPERPFGDIEPDVFGFTHAELGGLLGRAWKYPDALVIAIGDHDREMPSTPLAALVGVADLLVRENGVGIEPPCEVGVRLARRAGLDLERARARRLGTCCSTARSGRAPRRTPRGGFSGSDLIRAFDNLGLA